MEIANIKIGQTHKYREIYAEKYVIWDIEIPNCWGMISNKKESLLNFFYLKEYNEIFTIRLERGWDIQSLGNMYLYF